MERVKRRWWTWAVSSIAATVIVGAVLSGAFQLAVLAVPSYREDLATWVGDITGRPVQIGGISLSWRGLAPSFDLTGLTLFSEDGTDDLSVDRLSFGLGLRRIVTGQWMPSRLELSGLRVSAQVDDDGHIRIGGFGTGDLGQRKQGREPWLENLERFELVVLEDCELRLQHPTLGETPVSLRLQLVEIEKTGSGLAVTGSLRLPADRGGEVTLDAEIDGPVAQIREWDGGFELNFVGLQPQGWLRPWLLPGSQVVTADLNGTVVGEVSGGRVMGARTAFSSGGVVLARAGVLASAQRSTLSADYLLTPQGWRVDVTDLSFDGKPMARGMLRRDVVDGIVAYDLDADHLDVTRLAPWAGVWREGPEWLSAVGGSRGEVGGVVLRYRQGEGQAHYTVRAQLQDVEVRAQRKVAIKGIIGELSADENGGRLQLDGIPVEIDLPNVFDTPIMVDAVTAPLQWRRDASGWRIGAERFAVTMDSIDAQGRFDLLLSGEEGVSPEIDLAATLTAGDVLDAQPYLPKFWPNSLRDWLRQGIVAARVVHGDLRLRGPLADFPYERRRTGEWNLELETADAVLDYAPGWPRLEDIRARVALRGNGLRVTSDQARLVKSRVRAADVQLPNFNERVLTVQASVDGALPDHYTILRRSPLHDTLRALLDNTVPEGDGTVELQLQLPLADLNQTQVSGQVALDGATLRYGTLPQPIEKLKGSLRFNRQGVTADAITAEFAQVPVDVRIDAEEGSFGIIRGRFDYTPAADGSGLSQFVPGFLRPMLVGTSDWRLELPLRADNPGVELRSGLFGTEVLLPPPLSKARDEVAPLRVRISADEQADLRIGVGYDTRLGLNLGLKKADDGWQVDAMRARLGVDQVPIAEPGRVVVAGRVDELDVGRWAKVFSPLQSGAESADDALSSAGFQIDSVEIEAERVVWDRQSLPATRLVYRPSDTGGSVALSGEGAQGELQWQSGDNGRISARLQHLHLETLQPPVQVKEGESAPKEDPIDPARWPELDLICDALSLGEAQLGRAHVVARRIANGLSLDTLTLEGDHAKLTAGGQWQRSAGRSSADLRFDLDTGHIAQLLSGLGYAQNVEAQRSRIGGEVKWAPVAEGLRWEEAAGSIQLNFSDGQLRAVKPGASRVLGLINFYALPRRLTLNFDDVVGQGLAFDGINGNFALNGGVATTQDLRVDGPSLRMDIRGSVGLLAREYDQRVTVYPDVSAGVTLGAVLLGGPAVGALVLLAQELLDKPLDQVTQFSYRISGPWDNPRVERVDGNAGQG